MSAQALAPTPAPSLNLTADQLRQLAQSYGLQLPESGLVLFGLRGLTPAEPHPKVTSRQGSQPGSTPWVQAARLIHHGVDYRHLCCTLGLWNRDTDRIFCALASTVPHADQVDLAAAKKGAMKGRGTNQLEPGLYQDLTKGEHLQGKPRGHAALRQTGFRFYRRSHHTAPYTKKDPLYFGNPYDNLHCAWNLDGQAPGYSSAGCLVVAGLPHCPRQPESGPNQGTWKTFHDLIYAAKQKTFSLFLLSGAEVMRVLGEKKPTPRLVFGSRGEAVTALQKKLIKSGKMPGKPTGYLGTVTYRAWNAAGLNGYGDVLGS